MSKNEYRYYDEDKEDEDDEEDDEDDELDSRIEIIDNHGDRINLDVQFAAGRLEQLMRGGLSRERGVYAQDIDPEMLNLGTEVELEHTGDPMMAEKIALDHFAEHRDYYYGLALAEMLMEKKKLTRAIRILRSAMPELPWENMPF